MNLFVSDSHTKSLNLLSAKSSSWEHDFQTSLKVSWDTCWKATAFHDDFVFGLDEDEGLQEDIYDNVQLMLADYYTVSAVSHGADSRLFAKRTSTVYEIAAQLQPMHGEAKLKPPVPPAMNPPPCTACAWYAGGWGSGTPGATQARRPRGLSQRQQYLQQREALGLYALWRVCMTRCKAIMRDLPPDMSIELLENKQGICQENTTYTHFCLTGISQDNWKLLSFDVP